MAINFPIAVISDIHANLEALTVVFNDIDRRGIKTVVCLGDIIGYGPNPRECLDLVIERCAWALMGNHDYAVLFEPTNFNAGAEAAAFWTRRQFETEPDKAKRNRRWEFLGNLSIRQNFAPGFSAVHGSPRRPINEYIFADDVTSAPTKMEQCFERIDRACVVGHTHVQGVFTDEPEFLQAVKLSNVYRFNSHEKAIINVGSVGQPRDRDPRSAYAVLHNDRIDFVRLQYDIKSVARKIEAISELNDYFGQRLMDGR